MIWLKAKYFLQFEPFMHACKYVPVTGGSWLPSVVGLTISVVVSGGPVVMSVVVPGIKEFLIEVHAN